LFLFFSFKVDFRLVHSRPAFETIAYQQILADFCLQKDAAQHYCLKADYLAEWSGAQMLGKKV